MIGPLRPLLWVGSSRRDYREFPPYVQHGFGFELFLAQTGQHPPSAKAIKGFGSGVLELIDDFEGNAYRVVYVVRFKEAVYVLHAFKKKARRSIKTPLSEVNRVKRRLKDTELDHALRISKVNKP